MRTITMDVMKQLDPGVPLRAPLPHCALCGELIGVYEPLIVDGPAGRRTTSVAAEPDLASAAFACQHAGCVVVDVQSRR